MQSLKELIEGAFFHSWQRTGMVLGGLILALALPITIILTQQQQDLRQRASDEGGYGCTWKLVKVGTSWQYLCVANEGPVATTAPTPVTEPSPQAPGWDPITEDLTVLCNGGPCCTENDKLLGTVCKIPSGSGGCNCPSGWSCNYIGIQNPDGSQTIQCSPPTILEGIPIGGSCNPAGAPCAEGTGYSGDCIWGSQGYTCVPIYFTPTPTTSPCAPSSNKPLDCVCQNNSECSSGYCGVGAGGTNKKCKVQPTATNTPTPSTPVEVVDTSPSPSLTQYPQDETSIFLAVTLPGIGSNVAEEGQGSLNNNESPIRTAREVDVLIGNAAGTNITSLASGTQDPVSGTLTFDPVTFKYKGTVVLGNIPTDNYQLFVRFDNTLYKAISGFPLLTLGQVTTVPEISLLSGDIDRSNNSDDQMTIDDYNLFIACFKETEICTPQAKIRTDLDDNGAIDIVDLNLMQRAFANRAGDSPL